MWPSFRGYGSTTCEDSTNCFSNEQTMHKLGPISLAGIFQDYPQGTVTYWLFFCEHGRLFLPSEDL